ncbi:MAG: ABC transporter permease [bacterium]|nr:ABC transporter permease [bacterium]
MKLIDNIKIARLGLQRNRSRSILTILGIVIGIAAIIVMASMGSGAENLILGEISGLGSETIVVRPGREPKGPTDIAETLFSDSLKDRDAELLSRPSNVPDVIDIMPAVFVPGSASYEGETFKPTIFGGSAEFMSQAFGIKINKGALFNDLDTRQRASVAVIGSKVKKELFGDADAVGESIRIKDRKFRVVGVFADKGQTAFFNVDEVVIIPHTTAQTYILGINYFHEIIIKVSGPDVVARSVQDIENTLRDAHSITDPEKDDFFVVTQQGVVDQVKTIIGALTIFLASVVAIALVVGGVGVMNIMLVSVTERTREIGLRKTVGATTKDVMNQFLWEAILLTSVGGVIGIVLGGVFAFLMGLAVQFFTGLDWKFVFPIGSAILGFAASALVGLVFGLYPAHQASKKSPIEALRYE